MMIDPGLCGTRIDRYLVKKLLGVGGFGAVYRAEHTRTDASVALKVLRRDRAEDAQAVERFMREAKAVALLGSDHIVRVLDAEVSDEGVPFIAMELLEGQDLSELDKAKGPLHPERLVNIMIQALGALQAAHDKGIVHRDMKPANVFITKRRDASGFERDFVKILDFGISKMADTRGKALTLAGTTMGTPAYMAYEQFFDARAVDGRADVYSVAAILYELLSRQRPYVASSYGELVMKVEKETPLPLKSVAPMLPDHLCAIIDKGLQKDRDERWQSASAMSEALSKVGSLRGVVLKTEISYASVAPVDELAETKARAPTTEPRHQEPGGWVSARGEVKTVMMDPDLVAPEPAAVPEPAPSAPAPVGNSTVLMDPEALGVIPVVPTSSRGSVGNATVLMNPDAMDAKGPYRDTSPSKPKLQEVPAVVPPGERKSPSRSRLQPVVSPSSVEVDEAQVPTNKHAALPPEGNETLPPKSHPPTMLIGPRDEPEVVRPAPSSGPFGLGWGLVGALGFGGLVVIGLAVVVIWLALHRGH